MPIHSEHFFCLSAQALAFPLPLCWVHIISAPPRLNAHLVFAVSFRVFAPLPLRHAIRFTAFAAHTAANLYRCPSSRRCPFLRHAAALPCTSVLLSAVAGLIYPMPPRCRAGLCRCFSVRFSAAAQVGPAHCLCAADLTFAFAVLSCARPLLFCPHLCRCCSLPSMAFLCRRVSALVFADAFRHDSLPPQIIPEHCHAMPPPCKTCPCRRLSMQCLSLLFRRCSWRSNSLPPHIFALLCRRRSIRCISLPLLPVPALC